MKRWIRRLWRTLWPNSRTIWPNSRTIGVFDGSFLLGSEDGAVMGGTDE